MLSPACVFVATISIGAALLAGLWAMRMPIFKPPDERVHADYAFVLYDVGAPFRIEHARGSYAPVSEQVRYLDGRVGYRVLRYNAYSRVVPGYGSRTYRAALDASAPKHPRVATTEGSPLPYVSFAYPCGYYAAVAAVLWIGQHLTGSLWWSFLLARFWNSALLLVTIPLAYGALRESGVRQRAALAATAAVAFFPLVSWVGGYVQPDNLSLTLVTAAVYFGLRLRSRPERSVLPLALTIGVLFFVKEHYAVALWVSAWLLTATRAYGSRMRTAVNVATLSVLPAVAFALSLAATPVGHIVRVHAMLAGSSWRNPLGLALAGVADEFAGGSGFKDYWLYDMRDFTVLGVRVADAFVPVGTFVSIALFSLTVTAVAKLALRLARVAVCRSPFTALRLFGSGIAIHAYVAVTLIVLWAYVLSNGSLWLEGRYWLPVIVPLAIVMVATLLKLVRTGRRAPLEEAIAFSMLAISAATAPLMFAAMMRDYYFPPEGRLSIDRMALIDSVSSGSQKYAASAGIRLSGDDGLEIAGHAVDIVSGKAAERIEVQVDTRHVAIIRGGEATPALAVQYNDDALERAGFRIHLDTRRLATGPHRLTLYVVTARGSHIRFGNEVRFTLVGPRQVLRNGRLGERERTRERGDLLLLALHPEIEICADE